MVSSKGRALRAAAATLFVALMLAVPAAASATTVAAAAASQYNATPDCPVSASNPVCAWNVPVDSDDAFGAGDYGQCPYWVAEKYPSIVADDPPSDPEARDWDGGTWIEHAQQEDLPVTATPASGDVAVWQAEPSDPDGHVAYVEAVVNGGIIVSQMDGESASPFPAMQGTTEYITDANLSYFAQSYGLEFIATGDPSTTPLSDLEAAGAPDASAQSSDSTAITAPAAVATSSQPAVGAKTAGTMPKAKKTRKAKKAKKRAVKLLEKTRRAKRPASRADVLGAHRSAA